MASNDLMDFFGALSTGLEERRKKKQETEQAVELERRKRQTATQFPTPLEQEQVTGLKSEREIQQRRYGVGGLEEKEIERKRLSDFITGVSSIEKASSLYTSDLLLMLPQLQEAEKAGTPIAGIISDLERRKRESTFQQMKTVGELFGLEIKMPKEMKKKTTLPIGGGAKQPSQYKVGQEITKGGKRWKIVGFDKDGTPLVDQIK